MGELQAFSGHKTACPKCSGRDVGIVYCNQTWPKRRTYYGPECPGSAGQAVEHFHRSCKACGFEWLETVPQRDVPEVSE